MLFLILLIIRKMGDRNFLTACLNQIAAQVLPKLKYILPFLLVSFTVGESSPVINETIRYDIVKKTKTIGFIELQKTKTNKTTTYKIKSEVNSKFIIEFKANSKETYIYENDTLIYSSIYRTINNKVSVDQSLAYNEGSYFLKQKKENQQLNTEVIRCNLVQLYFQEPVNIPRVYCDKLNQHLTIKNLGNNKYKVSFPNNSYNIFNYKNGKCSSIEAGGTFYKVTLVPDYIEKL